MIQLKISLVNCYGIQSLNHEFDFGIGTNPAKSKAKAYAVYAPNGLMKSSFAKTFDALSKGEAPKEECYNRHSRSRTRTAMGTIRIRPKSDLVHRLLMSA